jgi:beta-phosphoglucomutase-like phosphatase (HAD superfamily)
MNNLILVDADGVLLNWEFAFDCWMNEHGHHKQDGFQFKYNIGKRYGIDDDVAVKLIKTFNESAAIGFLPPLRDAMHYVRKLHEEHGYVFHCITSLSTDKNAQKLRKMNLEKLFGETAFEQVICLGTGADKDEALEPYRDTECWWIEDKITNAEVGKSIGLRSVLIEHGHNMDYSGDIPVVKNWKEIYDMITGN